MSVRLIGVDCATDYAKVGLARGESDGAVLRVNEAAVCTAEETAAKRVAAWLATSEGPALVAIDAPLGWPAALGTTLSSHRAGQPIATDPNELFRRETDRFIKRMLGKQSLDVGADRIARTAHAALRFLEDLRAALGGSVPLAWRPALTAPISAIEVYPAATLVSHGFRSQGYKKPDQRNERREILESIGKIASLPADCSHMEGNADALDACVCLLAAHDFLLGYAMPPGDLALAQTESWIWARTPRSGAG